jgi:hypothetical protein
MTVNLFLPNISSFAVIQLRFRLGLELGHEALGAPKLDHAASS